MTNWNVIEVDQIPQWTVGDRLRKARSLTGLTTREFAKALGVSQPTVTQAENDNVKVRHVTILAWSLMTRVPVAWLETGQDPISRPGPDDGGGDKLPRLDSNQQPSGYLSLQVRSVRRRHLEPVERAA